MALRVIQPPKDEKQMAEVIKPVIEAALKFGLRLEPEPFIFSWLQGTRVLVQETDGKIDGVLLMAVGIQWLSGDFTATVLANAGYARSELLDFAKTIATALGAAKLTAEDPELQTQVDRLTRHRVLVEYELKEP